MSLANAKANRAVAQAMADAIARFAETGARELIHNVGACATARQGRAPGAPVDTGELRGSLRTTLDSPSDEAPVDRNFYPIPGASEIEAGLKGFRLGRRVYMKWIALHANIIEGGRRRDARGRMIGSEQAPDGFLHLAIDEAKSQMDRSRFDGRRWVRG